jgi:hypothetical protein
LQSLTGPILINCTRKNYRWTNCTKLYVINIEKIYKDVLQCNSCFYKRAPILCLSFPSTALNVLLVGAVYQIPSLRLRVACSSQNPASFNFTINLTSVSHLYLTMFCLSVNVK